MDASILKGTRVSKGYTQETLSKKIGVTIKTYNRKELGLVPFSIKEIKNITKALDLSLEQVDEIFFDKELTNRSNIA